ncbi:MAG: hypothetical protein LCI02_20085 [Proteobacteria bacterium]|nr:hypothetical protein [Pseudomonadota bacterium]
MWVLALAMAGLCASIQPAAAMPLQVSLAALDAPELAAEQAGASPQAQYVVAGRQPSAAPSAEPDEEVPLGATETLPHVIIEPVTEISGLALAAPAEVGLPAVEKTLAAEQALGDFAPQTSPDGSDGDDALDERPIAAEAATSPATPAAPSAGTALPDVEALRQQRATLQWVVLPLVLVAMALLWVNSQQWRHHRHRHSDGTTQHAKGGRSRRRRGRSGSAAPSDPHRA